MFAFNEVGLFDESSRQEKDANLFAAELLLDDDEVLQTLNEDNTFAFEEYDVTKTNITCKGWFVLNDEPTYKCKKMQIFLGTDASHLFYKLDTVRQNRPDVDVYLQKRLPTPQEYKESGFTASISRKDLPHDTYNFYVYYESNDHKVMRKMPYKIII